MEENINKEFTAIAWAFNFFFTTFYNFSKCIKTTIGNYCMCCVGIYLALLYLREAFDIRMFSILGTNQFHLININLSCQFFVLPISNAFGRRKSFIYTTLMQDQKQY